MRWAALACANRKEQLCILATPTSSSQGACRRLIVASEAVHTPIQIAVRQHEACLAAPHMSSAQVTSVATLSIGMVAGSVLPCEVQRGSNRDKRARSRAQRSRGRSVQTCEANQARPNKKVAPRARSCIAIESRRQANVPRVRSTLLSRPSRRPPFERRQSDQPLSHRILCLWPLLQATR